MNAPSARENAEVALATAWPESCRQQAIRLLQSTCGGPQAMAIALRGFVPELGRTIGQLLESNPARLLEWLELREDENALTGLLGELRAVGSEAVP